MTKWSAKLRRIWALTVKETRQILRDPSSIAIGVVFPLMMILLFGYGLSLDVTRVSVAVVDEDSSSDSAALIGAFRLSPYFAVTVLHSMAEAKTLVEERRADGALLIPSDFARRWHSGEAEVQILVNGTSGPYRSASIYRGIRSLNPWSCSGIYMPYYLACSFVESSDSTFSWCYVTSTTTHQAATAGTAHQRRIRIPPSSAKTPICMALAPQNSRNIAQARPLSILPWTANTIWIQ